MIARNKRPLRIDAGLNPRGRGQNFRKYARVHVSYRAVYARGPSDPGCSNFCLNLQRNGGIFQPMTKHRLQRYVPARANIESVAQTVTQTIAAIERSYLLLLQVKANRDHLYSWDIPYRNDCADISLKLAQRDHCECLMMPRSDGLI